MAPHPPFKELEASRPPWNSAVSPHFTQTLKPDWKIGDGAYRPNGQPSEHISIDPNADTREPADNYKLLISAIVPRPIGFISTRSADGSATNVSPFSFFNIVAADPPMFAFGVNGLKDVNGFKGVNGFEPTNNTRKDTLYNLFETGECVINVISEDYVDAANMTSIDAPYGVSEFDIAGLTRGEDTQQVRAPRVKEAVFSVEAKVVYKREFTSRRGDPDQAAATIFIVEGVHFWAREDALNAEKNVFEIDKLRPVSRLGGITYTRITDMFELPRRAWTDLSAEEKQLVADRAKERE
ncbi:hypothetical protein PISL3812_00922 [Talaromyces islandicus]|uniref:Flavin reductase like domain-containing protein n=1 Tax=Talaromyces islandicus TaxID=28573 RepID=A0A0U1LKL5_TALIS|nr:hypothetical protein PISL3812_00922 [Talaromyces islandicus]